MQFLDGNRIDLSFYALEQVELIVRDSLSLVLLDKDHLIKQLPPPSDVGYRPTGRAPRHLTIAAMSSGGSIPMSPRDCGAMS
jgi:hypothetical protein